MAGMFSKPKTPSAPKKKEDPSVAQAAENRKRRQAAGTYGQTIVGSGLKTALGQ